MAAMCLFVSVPAVAQQTTARTNQDYDLEVGAKYVYMSEEGGYSGTPGFLVDVGYGVWTFKGWRAQGVAELMVVRFDDVDATYKQFAAGVRFGRQLFPRIRAFGQFQLGVQNDGYPNNSATGFVIMPGGGVNYALTGWMDGQLMLDVPFVQYDNGTFNQVRVSVGVVFPFGGN